MHVEKAAQQLTHFWGILRTPRRPPRDRESLLLELLRRNFVFSSATLRRSAVEAVGGYTTFTRSEDYELWVDTGTEVRRITFGHILKTTEIRRFPI